MGKAARLYHLYDGTKDMGYYTFPELIDIINCGAQRLRESIKMGTRYRDRYKIIKTDYTNINQIPKVKLNKIEEHHVIGSEDAVRKTSGGRTYKLPIWS